MLIYAKAVRNSPCLARHVRTFDQGIHRDAIFWIYGNADTGADGQTNRVVACGNFARLLNRDDALFSNGADGLAIPRLHQQVQELVTTVTANGVVRPGTLFKALGNRSQDAVAGIMSVRIVDLLEPVQIHKHQRQMPFLPLRHRQSLFQTIHEERAVRQPRQWIVKSCVSGGLFLLGDGSKLVIQHDAVTDLTMQGPIHG